MLCVQRVPELVSCLLNESGAGLHLCSTSQGWPRTVFYIYMQYCYGDMPSIPGFPYPCRAAGCATLCSGRPNLALWSRLGLGVQVVGEGTTPLALSSTAMNIFYIVQHQQSTTSHIDIYFMCDVDTFTHIRYRQWPEPVQPEEPRHMHTRNYMS